MSYSVSAAGQARNATPQVAVVTAASVATAVATGAKGPVIRQAAPAKENCAVNGMGTASNGTSQVPRVAAPAKENCAVNGREVVSSEKAARIRIRVREDTSHLTPPPPTARAGCSSVGRGIRQQVCSFLPPAQSLPLPEAQVTAQPSAEPTEGNAAHDAMVQQVVRRMPANLPRAPGHDASASYLPSARAHSQSVEPGQSYSPPVGVPAWARTCTVKRVRRATEHTPSYLPVNAQPSPMLSARQSQGGRCQPSGVSISVEPAPDPSVPALVTAQVASLEKPAEELRSARVRSALPVWSKDATELEDHVMHRNSTQSLLKVVPSEVTEATRQSLSYIPSQTSRPSLSYTPSEVSRKSLSHMPREITEARRAIAPRLSLPDGGRSLREATVTTPSRSLLCQRSESHLIRYQAAVDALKGESLLVRKERAVSVDPVARMVCNDAACRERAASVDPTVRMACSDVLAQRFGASTCTTAAAPPSARSSSVQTVGIDALPRSASVRTAHVIEWRNDTEQSGLAAVKQQEWRRQQVIQVPAGALELRGASASIMKRDLTVDELSYDGDRFDAASSSVRKQIVSKMGLPDTSTIELMAQQGGINQGLWLLHASDQNFVLKLVTCQRMHPMMPTEAEQFVKLAREHPSLLHDDALAFPVKIFRCRGKNAEAFHDLVVMRQAPGQVFSDVIGKKLQANRTAELMRSISSLGTFLADVHARHGMEHGDFTPSNVFYDERRDVFTLVDVSDFGPQQWNRRQSDAERFIQGLELVTRSHVPHLFSEFKRHFETGYKHRSIHGH